VSNRLGGQGVKRSLGGVVVVSLVMAMPWGRPKAVLESDQSIALNVSNLGPFTAKS